MHLKDFKCIVEAFIQYGCLPFLLLYFRLSSVVCFICIFNIFICFITSYGVIKNE